MINESEKILFPSRILNGFQYLMPFPPFVSIFMWPFQCGPTYVIHGFLYCGQHGQLSGVGT